MTTRSSSSDASDKGSQVVVEPAEEGGEESNKLGWGVAVVVVVLVLEDATWVSGNQLGPLSVHTVRPMGLRPQVLGCRFALERSRFAPGHPT